MEIPQKHFPRKENSCGTMVKFEEIILLQCHFFCCSFFATHLSRLFGIAAVVGLDVAAVAPGVAVAADVAAVAPDVAAVQLPDMWHWVARRGLSHSRSLCMRRIILY